MRKKTVKDLYVLPPAVQNQLRHAMQRMSVMILGAAVVYPLFGEDIGCSSIEKGTPNIGINFAFQFHGVSSEAEAKMVLLGVFVHEMLHLILTDFEYTYTHISSYPVLEQHIRMTVMNILEDPAIEYLRSSRIAGYLNRCLDANIRYFSRTETRIDRDGSSPLTQLLNALIQFGDLGFVRGSFTYQDAEEAFYKIIPLMNEGIKTPEFKKRFDIGMKIADIVLPFYTAEQEDMLKSLMRGKNDFNSNKQNMNGNDASGSGAIPIQTPSSKRRDLTVHLVDEEEKKQRQDESPKQEDIDNSSDLYVNTNQKEQNDQSDDPIDLSGRDIKIVDERKNKHQKTASDEQAETSMPSSQAPAADQRSHDEEMSADGQSAGEKASKSGQDAADSNQSSQPEPKDAPAEAESTESQSTENGAASADMEPMQTNLQSAQQSAGHAESESGIRSTMELEEQQSHASGDSSKGAKAEDADAQSEVEPKAEEKASEAPVSEKDAEEKTADADPEEQVSSRADEDVSDLVLQNIRRRMKAAQRKFTKEADAEQKMPLSPDDLAETDAMTEKEKKIMADEEVRAKKQAKAEDIHPEVGSPYYGDVPYTVQEISADHSSDLRMNFLKNDLALKQYVVSLTSSFKKIFHESHTRKEYKMNGRLDMKRAFGNKLTARIFNRKTMPNDKSDLAVVFLIDESYSMKQSIERVKQTMVLLLESLRSFDVKVKIVGFASPGRDIYKHYGASCMIQI